MANVVVKTDKINICGHREKLNKVQKICFTSFFQTHLFYRQSHNSYFGGNISSVR